MKTVDIGVLFKCFLASGGQSEGGSKRKRLVCVTHGAKQGEETGPDLRPGVRKSNTKT